MTSLVDRKTAEAMLDEYTTALRSLPGLGPGEARQRRYDEARAAVLDAMTPPEGYVLVPKELTGKMWSEARRVFNNCCESVERSGKYEERCVLKDTAPGEM